MKRRHFLKLSAATTVSSVFSSPLVFASDSDKFKDFKALVCVYLAGGNDGFNTVVPLDKFHFQQYEKARSDLALQSKQIVPISPLAIDRYSKPVALGLHPSMLSLKHLFDQGKGNVILNSGILSQPLTKSGINSGQALPPQLFSHNSQSQEWFKGAVGQNNPYGWAGRMMDVLGTNEYMEPAFSLGRETPWLRAKKVQQNVVKVGKINKLTLLDKNDKTRKSFLQMNDKSSLSPFHDYILSVRGQALVKNNLLSRHLSPLPDSNQLISLGKLGSQLNMVLKLIKLRANFNHQRQVYFVKLGGFDTHDDQLERHPILLKELSDAIAQFYSELENLEMQSKVATFTMSDFGRRIAANGKGSDHGWGSHQLVFGGALNAKHAIGLFPNITLGGEDDVGVGRIIPTISNDQVGATLAKWMGVSKNGMSYVFPNINNFVEHDLGFLS